MKLMLGEVSIHTFHLLEAYFQLEAKQARAMKRKMATQKLHATVVQVPVMFYIL